MTSTSIASRTPCPYCTTPLGDAPAHECEGCGARHHADCWSDNGGCAVALCREGPEGSDPALRPPVAERRMLIVDVETQPTPDIPNLHADEIPSPVMRLGDAERRMVVAVLLAATIVFGAL